MKFRAGYFLGGWRARGGILEVLKIALPLILASAGHAINMFTDRMMLQWYSTDAMAAAFPAGLTSFAMTCFFVGTVGYAGSFVAQYTGAGMEKRVGVSVWQAVHVSFLGELCMLPAAYFAPEIFRFFGHEPRIQPLEVEYFRIMAVTTAVPLLMIALSTFWSGRGKTLMIMAVNLFVTLVNIPLNYAMIFGVRVPLPGIGELVIPEMGVAGAAWATVIAGFCGMLVFAAAFFRKSVRTRFATTGPIFDGELFRRLIRYGAPTGFQLLLDLLSFNIFIVLMGKISVTVLAAATVAFSINALAFTPMLGVGQTVSILVGQGVGGNDIPYAVRILRSARTLTLSYMLVMAVFFVLYPDPIFRSFRLAPGGDVENVTRIMLYFISAYLLFDGMAILYSSAVKGTGDTCVAMWIGILMAWFAYAIPSMICFYIFTKSSVAARLGPDLADQYALWSMWTVCVLYIMGCGCLYYLRYRTGKWQKMKVIESVTETVPSAPESGD